MTVKIFTVREKRSTYRWRKAQISSVVMDCDGTLQCKLMVFDIDIEINIDVNVYICI